MIRAAQIYVITTLIYFYFGSGSMYWAWFNMVSVLGTLLVFLGASLKRGAVSKNAKAWAEFAGAVTVVRMLYTSICVISSFTWIEEGNKIFTYIILLWITIKIARGYLKVR